MLMRDDILEKEQEIRKWIEENQSNAEIARRLNCKVYTLQSYYKKMGIEYSGNQSGKGIKRGYKKSITEFLLSNASNSAKRKRLIEEGIKESKCEICQLSEWMGQPIPLELHHIDFNHYNNDLSNLQILCSNCHMQVHNYNNNFNKEEINYSDYETESEFTPISNNQTLDVKKPEIQQKERIKLEDKECPMCHKIFHPKTRDQKYCSPECFHKTTQKGMPSKEILIERIKEYNCNFTKIGQSFGVTDNAIKKWCNKLELPRIKKDLKEFIENLNKTN